MTRFSVKQKRWIFILSLFIMSVFLFYGMEMGREEGINSDETSIYFVGEDFFRGNFFVKDWYFSTGLFFLPMYEITVLTKIFGFHDGIIYLIAGINYALLIVLTLYAVYIIGEKYEVKNRINFVVFAALFIYIPRADMIYNSGTHVLCVAFSIACLYFFYKLQNLKIKFWIRCVTIVVASIVIGHLSTTNTMFMYSALIPLILTGLCIVLEKHEWKEGLHYIIPGILSVIWQEIWKFIYLIARGGIRLGSSSTAFVHKDHLWASICESLYDTLELFYINIWNKEVFSLNSIEAVLGIIILCKLIVELVKFLKSKKDRYAVLVYMFLMMALVNFCSYMCSTMALIHRSTHLLFPILFGITAAGTIAWIMNIHNQVSYRKCRQYVIIVAALFLIMLPDLSWKQPEAYIGKVAEYLTQNGYTDGYGGYWSTASTMYYARGYGNKDMNIYPIAKDTNGRMALFHWMTKNDQIGHKGNFFIYNQTDMKQMNLTDDDILNTFGKWTKKLEFDGGIMLYLWSDQISTNGLWGSHSYNAQMSVSNSTMRQPDGNIMIRSSEILFGPYLNLDKGSYNLIVEASKVTDQKIRITADCGKKEIISFNLMEGSNFYTIYLKENMQNVEFTINGTEASNEKPLQIQNIYFAKSDMHQLASAMGTGFNLQKGKYKISIYTEYIPQNAVLTVTAKHRSDVCAIFQLTSKDEVFYFDLAEQMENVEFMVQGVKGEQTILKSISLQKVYDMELEEQMTEKDDGLISPIISLESGVWRVVTKFGKDQKDAELVVVDSSDNVLAATSSLQKGETGMLFTINNMDSIRIRINGKISQKSLKSIKITKINFAEYLSKMQCSMDFMRQEDGTVVITDGNMIFGPEIDVEAGRHCLKVYVLEMPEKAEVVVRSGMEDIGTYSLKPGENIFDVYIDNEDILSLEFIVHNASDVPIHIKEVMFE